jgi:hypothetical protein
VRFGVQYSLADIRVKLRAAAFQSRNVAAATVPPAWRSITSAPGSRYARGRSSTASTTVKIAVEVPMPTASVTAATTVKLGDRASSRTAKRASRTRFSIPLTRRASRASSLRRSTPPIARRASVRASAGLMPRATCSSICRSTW